MGEVIWLTGLSGSGKSTIAQKLQSSLECIVLDGDNLRRGLCSDLGFTDADRKENIRRVGEVAKLIYDAGITVIVSLISPFEADRQTARSLIPAGDFVEIYIDCPLAVCEARDPKGNYARARRGEIKQFTGIDSVYEIPINPEITLNTATNSIEKCTEEILSWLTRYL
jgi:adenylylsulfate kinase